VSTTDTRLAPIVEDCRATDAIALVGAPIEQDGRTYIAALRIDSAGSARAASGTERQKGVDLAVSRSSSF
jgi:hypothetical protein